MDAKRQADELASRCVALVIYLEHFEKTRRIKSEIIAEIREVATEASKEGISAVNISAEVLSELQARYDPATARRLHRAFLVGFEAGLPMPVVLVRV